MTACIYYAPEGYSTDGPKLMGRNAAGEAFLRGFLQYSQATEFQVLVKKAEHARRFSELAKSFGRTEPVKMILESAPEKLARAGTLYTPGPNIGREAYQRAAGSRHGGWSLCGITHTTASLGAMDAIASLVTAPVQPWDALICTSKAVKDNVLRIVQAEAEYLKDRLGITKTVMPQTPVIPLGIHTEDFVFSTAQRAKARKKIGAHKNTIVVLFMGRLAFHAKAHPMPMYLALEKTAQETGKRIILVECGWHALEASRQSFAQGAKALCPNVEVITLDGRQADNRRTAWASADMFCSLSDNLQETFGITPVEAMAAGLPVVVSDWDGYKDTVRDGVDGFRVPTIMPPSGYGRDFALRHAMGLETYDRYCGHTCALIAVDIEATAKAFIQLISSPDLAKKMGKAGRKRAREVYDWKVIMPQYEDLWGELKDIRLSRRQAVKSLSHPWPARLDPFHAFASYPTQAMTWSTSLELVDGSPQEAMARLSSYRELSFVSYAKFSLPTDAEVEKVFDAAASPQTAQLLVANVSQSRKFDVFRGLSWLVKLGLLRVVEDS